jgi:hypothetical protein
MRLKIASTPLIDPGRFDTNGPWHENGRQFRHGERSWQQKRPIGIKKGNGWRQAVEYSWN